MKTYGELFRNDSAWSARAQAFAAKVRDVTEVLSSLGPQAPRHRLDMRIAYHDACHLGHAQGIRQEPRDLLAAIPGVTLVLVAESDICCGSAGIFNLVQPEMAAELGRRKAAHIAAASPDIIATTNPGCMLQITAVAGGRKRPADCARRRSTRRIDSRRKTPRHTFMIIDPSTIPAQTMYRVLIGAVVPRPIAFVSTMSAAGVLNLAPFSFFNAFCADPPVVGFVRCGGRRPKTPSPTFAPPANSSSTSSAKRLPKR
jgi:hypothetical protein